VLSGILSFLINRGMLIFILLIITDIPWQKLTCTSVKNGNPHTKNEAERQLFLYIQQIEI
jgi:hypothetical protein